MERLQAIQSEQPDAEFINLTQSGLEDVSHLVEQLNTFPNLKSLCLADNKITHVFCDLSGLSSLEIIDLRYNPISNVDNVLPGLRTLPRLRELYLPINDDQDEEKCVMDLPFIVNINGIVLDGGSEGPMSDAEISQQNPAEESLEAIAAQEVEIVDSLEHHSEEGEELLESNLPVHVDSQEDPKPEENAEIEIELSEEDLSAAAKMYDSIRGLADNLTEKEQNEWTERFNSHIQQTLTRLRLRLETKPNQYLRRAEILKTKHDFYDICFKEIIGQAIRIKPQFGGVLRSLREVHREIVADFPAVVSTAYADMEKEIQEINQKLLDSSEELHRQSLVEKVGFLTTENSKQAAEIKRLKHSLATLRRRQEYRNGSNSYAVKRQISVQNLKRLHKQRKSQVPKAARGSTKAVAPRPKAEPPAPTTTRYSNVVAPAASSPPPPNSPTGSVSENEIMELVPDKQEEKKGLRQITLAQLKEHISLWLRSKTRHNVVASKLHTARETPLQHLYTYLTHKYGIKPIVKDVAMSVQYWADKFSTKDNDVAVFRAVVKDTIDEDFVQVQSQLKATIKDLLRAGLRARHTGASEDEISERLQNMINGYVEETEFLDVVRLMYNHEDAVAVIVRIKEIMRRKVESLMASAEDKWTEDAPVIGLGDSQRPMDLTTPGRPPLSSGGTLSYRQQASLRRQETMAPRGAVVTTFGVDIDNGELASTANPRPAPPLPPPFLTDREFEPRIAQSPLASYPVAIIDGVMGPSISARAQSALQAQAIETDNKKLLLFSELGHGKNVDTLPVTTAHGRRYVSFSDFDRNPIGAPLTREQLEKEWRARSDAALHRIRFKKFMKVLLDFQLEQHVKFLERLAQLYSSHRPDESAPLTESGFRRVVIELKPDCTEGDMKKLLNKVDPYRTLSITFTECVRALLPVLMLVERRHAENPNVRGSRLSNLRSSSGAADQSFVTADMVAAVNLDDTVDDVRGDFVSDKEDAAAPASPKSDKGGGIGVEVDQEAESRSQIPKEKDNTPAEISLSLTELTGDG